VRIEGSLSEGPRSILAGILFVKQDNNILGSERSVTQMLWSLVTYYSGSNSDDFRSGLANQWGAEQTDIIVEGGEERSIVDGEMRRVARR
jgi:hypothetical protein